MNNLQKEWMKKMGYNMRMRIEMNLSIWVIYTNKLPYLDARPVKMAVEERRKKNAVRKSVQPMSQEKHQKRLVDGVCDDYSR